MRNQLKLADTYYRLSDEEKKRGESSSIGNQRQLVESYCRRNNIVIVREFVDDGYSGGNFDRPGFQALLAHLKSGKANMVITKDLSRLGRDMSESSYYAERYFPEKAGNMPPARPLDTKKCPGQPICSPRTKTQRPLSKRSLPSPPEGNLPVQSQFS